MDGFDAWKRIWEFWPRKLSFQSDALDAFSGILTAFETHRGNNMKWKPRYRGHLYGLPIVSWHGMSSKAAILRSLCWNL